MHLRFCFLVHYSYNKVKTAEDDLVGNIRQLDTIKPLPVKYLDQIDMLNCDCIVHK